MGCSVTLTGKLAVGGEGCGCAGNGAPSKQVPLAFACQGLNYGAIVSTDCPVQVQTFGVPGTLWQELPGGALGSYRLLYLLTKAPMKLRVGAAPAALVGSAAAFPVTLAGGETFTPVVDGVAVPVTFTSGAKTAAQIATAINQAAVGAGLTTLPASVDVSGQVRIAGTKTGDQGAIAVTTALASIGFASTSAAAKGAGSDLSVNGLALLQFDEASAPTRIQISGSGMVEVLAAGAAA